jgi:hypothetical protein
MRSSLGASRAREERGYVGAQPSGSGSKSQVVSMDEMPLIGRSPGAPNPTLRSGWWGMEIKEPFAQMYKSRMTADAAQQGLPRIAPKPEFGGWLHRRQFIIGPEPLRPYAEWLIRELPHGLYFTHCPTLPVRDSEHGLVLGLAIASDDRDDPDGWAGRWVLLTGTTLSLDASGLLGVFIRGRWLSSSPELLRTLSPELPLPVRRLRYNEGMDWFAPPGSGIDGIGKLLPSQTIDIATGEVSSRTLLAPVAHRSDRERVTALADRLVRTVESAARRYDELLVALTAGRDSRLVLAAAIAAGAEVSAYTFFLPHMNEVDRTLPPRLCASVGVRHFATTPGDARPEIYSLFDQHCAHHCVEANRPGLATRAIGWSLGNVAVLPGNGFEVGRCQYYGKLPRELNERVLATSPMLAHEPRERVGISDWARWIDDHPDPLDWRDRFYIEQILAGWLSSTAQAGDLAGPPEVWVANSRRFISELLQFPEAVRMKAFHQDAVLEALSPKLARLPVNVVGSRTTVRLRRELSLVRRDRVRYFARRIRAVRAYRTGRRLAP